MGTLQIHLFGSIRLYQAQQPNQIKLTRSVSNLLAFLLLHRYRLYPREVLAGVFWGNQGEEQARKSLSTAIWRLRRLLEPEAIPKGTYLRTTSMGEVGFNQDSDHWLDVAVFEDKVSHILAKKTGEMNPEDTLQLENALRLCESELLEGFYDDWAVRERERLRLLLIKTLRRLMHYTLEAEAYDDGLDYGQKILDLDPLREEIHREMMRLYMKNGQRSLAIRQFETCRRLLAKELDIYPMEDTRKLYGEILQADSGGQGESGRRENEFRESDNTAVLLDLALQNLNLAAKELEKGQKQLKHSIDLLQRSLRDVGMRKHC
jgi:DNA-binding SARP family transcriptional activator